MHRFNETIIQNEIIISDTKLIGLGYMVNFTEEGALLWKISPKYDFYLVLYCRQSEKPPPNKYIDVTLVSKAKNKKHTLKSRNSLARKEKENINVNIFRVGYSDEHEYSNIGIFE